MKKFNKQPNKQILITNSSDRTTSYTNSIINSYTLLNANKVNMNEPSTKRKLSLENDLGKPKKQKALIFDMTVCDSEHQQNDETKSNDIQSATTNGYSTTAKRKDGECAKICSQTKKYLMDIYRNKQESASTYLHSPDLFLDSERAEEDDRQIKAKDKKNDTFKYPQPVIKKQPKSSHSKNCTDFKENEVFDISQFFKTSQFDKLVSPQPNTLNMKNNIMFSQGSNFTQMLKSTQINELLDNTNLLRENSSYNNAQNIMNEEIKINPDPFGSSQIFKAYDLESVIVDAEKLACGTTCRSDLSQKDEANFIGPENLITMQKNMVETNKVNVSLEDGVEDNKLLGAIKSSQYKKEIDELFNVCEMSICNNSIFNEKDDEKGDSNQTLGLAAIQDINWENDSMIAKEIKDEKDKTISKISIYDTIKEKLLKNAQKVIEPLNTIQTNTSHKTKNTFISKGPFYGLPIKCQELIYQYKNISKLYDWQDECLRLIAIQQRKNLIYALPTSGGKTLVAEILILREILCRKKNVIFILPFVSIVQEKIWAMSPFAVSLEFLVEEYAGGKGACPPRKRRHKNSVFIATIEKSLGLINSLIEIDRLHEIGLVVVDELHLLGEHGRGATLEIVLSKLLTAKYDIQIVGMSATIGNISEIAQFLNADVYTRDFRPVELKEYAKCGTDLMSVHAKAQSVEDIFTFERCCKYNYTDMQLKMDPDYLAGLVLEVLPESSCLVFCPTKQNCENVASLICRIFPRSLLEYRKEDKKGLCDLIKKDCGTICPILSKTLLYGVAYHHSGLTSDERKLLEDAYRVGVISVICCTSTLAAGVNLPAKRVILRSPYVGKEFITLSRYKQMVGRAGRAGYGENGESILIFAPKDRERVQNLLHSPMDEALSSLHYYNGEGIKNLILSLVGLNIATTRSQILAFMSKTLMAVQAERLEINVNKITNKTISSLFKLGALTTKEESKKIAETITENSIILSQSQTENKPQTNTKKYLVISRNTCLAISKLGKAAARACINLKRAHMLYNDLLQAQSGLVLLNCLHILYLVTPYEQCEQIKPNMPIYYSIYTKLGTKELETAKVLGIDEACAIKMLSGKQVKNVSPRVLNRFYTTLMLYDLWNHEAVHDVADKFHISRGVVQSLMTSAASFSSSVLRFCEELEEFWAFKDLLVNFTLRLQHCCSLELLPLMELPNVKISRAKQLYNAGYKTLHLIAKTTPKCLMRDIEHLNRKIASQLISTAKLLLLEKVETLKEEAEDVLEGLWAT